MYGADITERIRAEGELKKHEEDLEKLVEKRTSALSKSEASLAEAQRIAHLGNWDWNIVDNKLRWSDEVYRIFGFSPQEFGVTYEAFLSSVHPEDREYVKEAADQALCKDGSYSIDHRIVLPDGSGRVVHEQGRVFHDERGKAVRMIGTVQDITERKEMEKRIQTINSLLRTFIVAPSRKQYLDSLVDLLRDVSGCSSVGIRVSSTNDWVPYGASVGFDKGFMASECWLQLGEDDCVCTRVADGKPAAADVPCMTPDGAFRCENIPRFLDELPDQERLRFRGLCMQSGFLSLAVMPVKCRGAALGVVHLADEAEGRIPPKVMEFLETINPLIGEAVHRFNIEDELRTLSSQLSLAEEQERKRLAAALHDSVGQTLALSKLKLGELGRLLSSGKAQTKLAEIRDIFEKGIQQLRLLTFELSPPILYELGLGPALEWLGEQFEQQHAVKCHFETDGEAADVDEIVSVLIFQSVREVLANVAKHAEAQHVKVSVSMRDGRVTLAIGDDGLGFDANAYRNYSYEQHSFGLFSIRERMRHIGGTMSIESKPGIGTTVTLSAPMKGNTERGARNGKWGARSRKGESNGKEEEVNTAAGSGLRVPNSGRGA